MLTDSSDRALRRPADCGPVAFQRDGKCPFILDRAGQRSATAGGTEATAANKGSIAVSIPAKGAFRAGTRPTERFTAGLGACVAA